MHFSYSELHSIKKTKNEVSLTAHIENGFCKLLTGGKKKRQTALMNTILLKKRKKKMQCRLNLSTRGQCILRQPFQRWKGLSPCSRIYRTLSWLKAYRSRQWSLDMLSFLLSSFVVLSRIELIVLIAWMDRKKTVKYSFYHFGDKNNVTSNRIAGC